ncbi:putative fructose-bisphosphate aldolase 3, chloroplastic [Cocos nucifera]|uniref:fructose-bisphosphate aldolase n=1 Tax=Cocos nucifera TaxID=13894 RepID=A0A8K0I3T3_COCNU|nr:putative fructose-bisphosphate aldolase 3, chloroplastic [Cocos nucifera]
MATVKLSAPASQWVGGRKPLGRGPSVRPSFRRVSVPVVRAGSYTDELVQTAFLSGGQSEVEATLNLNAMNQGPNPWHVSFSYARALQNTVLKTWQGRPENVEAAQKALLVRAKANSLAQLGRYSGEDENEEAKKGMFEKGYTY